MTLSAICEKHVEWDKANPHPDGLSWDHHAFNHTSGPKGDYCFWCGVHRDGDHYYPGDAGAYSKEDWDRDVGAQFGEPVDDVMTKVHAFYNSLSPEDRKRVCSFNPMGHPYPSLLT